MMRDALKKQICGANGWGEGSPDRYVAERVTDMLLDEWPDNLPQAVPMDRKERKAALRKERAIVNELKWKFTKKLRAEDQPAGFDPFTIFAFLSLLFKVGQIIWWWIDRWKNGGALQIAAARYRR